jgi:hypothetical protein
MAAAATRQCSDGFRREAEGQQCPIPLARQCVRAGHSAQVIHAKLDELLRAEGRARSELALLDDEEPEVIEAHRAQERFDQNQRLRPVWRWKTKTGSGRRLASL